MAAGCWQGWQSWGASSSCDESRRDNKCKEVENGINDFTRVERREGILHVKKEGNSNWSVRKPGGTNMKKRWLGASSSWKENFFVTGELTSDDLAEHGERSGTRRVYCDGRLGVRRFDRFFPIWQDELEKDRKGKLKQAWPLR